MFYREYWNKIKYNKKYRIALSAFHIKLQFSFLKLLANSFLFSFPIFFFLSAEFPARKESDTPLSVIPNNLQ